MVGIQLGKPAGADAVTKTHRNYINDVCIFVPL